MSKALKTINAIAVLVLTVVTGFMVSVSHSKTESPNLDGLVNFQEIVNGVSASTLTYPWIAFLADEDGEQYCGASLISPTWILTAAHCFLNEAGNEVDIVTGARSSVILGSDTVSPLAENAINGQIGQIIIHPNYQPDKETSPNENDFDIALVEITAAVSQQPINLLTASAPALQAGTEVRILGWGTTAVNQDNESVNPSNSLLSASQFIVSDETCSAAYGSSFTANMICANSAGDDTDTCQGDSGGPLAIASGESFVQVGIVSFGGTETGPTCGDPDAPGVYASVAALAEFIQQNTTEVVFTTIELGTGTGTGTGSGNDSGSGGTGASAAPILTVTVNGTSLSLSWTGYEGATGYILYYAPFPSADPIGSLDMGAMTSVSGELPEGAAFYVAIQPYNTQGGIDVFSNIEQFTIQGQGGSSAAKLSVAQVETACSGIFDTSPTENSLSFMVDGNRAIFRGVIDSGTPQRVADLIDNNPEVGVIVLAFGPGSDDDEANLLAAQLIRQAGISTCVPDGGEIYSGAVDFFLAGVIRRLGEDTIVGVHSWADGDGIEGASLAQDHPDHQLFLDFYDSIGVSADFYWFSLQAAPANDIHNMTEQERIFYNMETQ